MGQIEILDCTLRDGGYVNEWNFGKHNISKIIKKLGEARLDIVECGFLTNKGEYSEDYTKFNKIVEMIAALPQETGDLPKYVCMVNYGEYCANDLPVCSTEGIVGIRIAFHKNDMKEAVELGHSIKEKGYLVFLQPMVSLNYSDFEFLELITMANELRPYAFYIVDSFGVMKSRDLKRYYYLVEHNLNKEIKVGFHSHNNMQLAYANALNLLQMCDTRDVIIDTSVLGMGRGAGNLNTELFVEHLNDVCGKEYRIQPILQIADEVLEVIFAEHPWGYSLPQYLSAVHGCHPNYATFLDDKNTLKIESIHSILDKVPDEKKNNFDKQYIMKLYEEFQSHALDDTVFCDQLRRELAGQTVVLIGPGNSITVEEDKIKNVLEKGAVAIALNFEPEAFSCKYVFVSNIKRFENMQKIPHEKLIATSNLVHADCNKVNYGQLINDIEGVKDNACLMLIKLLKKIGVRKIGLAGIDGYSYNLKKNYASPEMVLATNAGMVDILNKGMKKGLLTFRDSMDIFFVTEPQNIVL